MTMTQSTGSGGCIKMNVLAGTTANTNIAVAGIATEDIIVGCLHFTTAASISTVADVTSTVSITSAGNIQTSDDYSSDALVLFWIDRSA
jgi:hypothetical protein